MSMEKALLAKARPYMLAAKAKEILRREVSKGCLPEILPQSVALEPAYHPILGGDYSPVVDCPDHWLPEEPPSEDDLVRLQIWVSPEQKCDWVRSELMLKQLSHAGRRISLEILGNQERIWTQILCHRADQPIIQAAFVGQFEQCMLTVSPSDLLRGLPAETWAEASFWDFFPPPPYSHLFTRPDELQRSPYATLISVLGQIPDPAIGIYQVAFQSVLPEHNWHQNVQALVDLEYSIKLIGGLAHAQRLAQQAPSGDLRQMAMDVEVKSHTDKPFFAAALRIGILDAGEQAQDMLRAMAVVTGLIQHGGRPLDRLSDRDYRLSLSSTDIRRMFVSGVTYRPGFLANSLELTSLVHVPPPEICEHVSAEMNTLETLPAPPALSVGTPIGFSVCAGLRQPVCIPPDIRGKHVHLIGRSGTGKSTVVESMVLYDVSHGQGVAVLDPHGRLVQRILSLLPAEYADRVIFIDPGDLDWVPRWNPFRCGSTLGISRIADDLVRAFKSFVTGWGDRLEHLLRHAIFALLHLPGSSLLDVSNLLRSKSDESQLLRAQVLKVIDHQVAKLFWRHDFERYSASDLSPAQHKLSKLLTSGTVSLMLSQSESAFDLREIMDSGKILLVDLSKVGPETREILGCFMLSLLHLTALSRGAAPDDSHRPFHIYCDEAHRFMTDAMEDMIAETRKFNVSLTLAHQYMSQFNTRKSDALSSVGSTIIFNVDTKDAQHLRKDLQGLVDLEDMITLEVGQAIARIGTHVVRLGTVPPLAIPADNCRDLIITQSHARYCRPTADAQRAVETRNERWQAPLSQEEPGRGSPEGFDTNLRRRRRSGGRASPLDRSNTGAFDYDEI